MSVAAQEVGPDPVPDTTLRELEEETERGLWEIILPAAVAQGASGATLRQVVDRVVALVRSASSRAMTLGAALAHALAPSGVVAARRARSGGRTPSGVLGVSGGLGRPGESRPAATLPTPAVVAATVLGVDAEVRGWLGRAATALDAVPGTAPPQARMRRLEQIVRGLWGNTLTRLHRLVNAGSAWVSTTFNLGLLWHTRADERRCAGCEAMNGRVLSAASRRFAAPSGEGLAAWQGFGGLPPLHPRCRCFVRPVAR